jgi:hypothetical protein
MLSSCLYYSEKCQSIETGLFLLCLRGLRHVFLWVGRTVRYRFYICEFYGEELICEYLLHSEEYKCGLK